MFAPDKATTLQPLKMVFDRLRSLNLKLAPRKCFFLRRSGKFLGHIVDESGVSTDLNKVKSIIKLTSTNLMEVDSVTPSQKRLRSILGMVNYYQHFVPRFSAVAKPLFDLLKGSKRKLKGRSNVKMSCRKLSAADWTTKEEKAFEDLKMSLVNSVFLAHPDFSHPFLLFTDAS